MGLAHRLGWLVDNTQEAVRSLLSASPPRSAALRYRRALVVLSTWRQAARPERAAKAPDVLDADIRSAKSRTLAEQQRSETSKRWGVLSNLQPEDFARAIEAGPR